MEYDLSFIPEKVTVEECLEKLYKGVRETNEFLGIDVEDPDTIKMYKKLTQEEVSEIFEAIEKKDLTLFVDGVVDSLVIVSYLCYLCDRVEPEHSVDLDTKSLGIDTYLQELKDGLGCKWLVIDRLENIFSSLPINHDKAASEVLNSNWSKFPEVGYAYPELEVKEIESQGRYSEVTYEVRKDAQGNDRYIFWAGSEYGVEYPTKKYIKPSAFSEPDFKSCIVE